MLILWKYMEVNIYIVNFSDSEIIFWVLEFQVSLRFFDCENPWDFADGGDGQMVKSRLAAPPSMESRLNWMSLRCLIMGNLTCAIFLQEIFHTIYIINYNDNCIYSIHIIIYIYSTILYYEYMEFQWINMTCHFNSGTRMMKSDTVLKWVSTYNRPGFLMGFIIGPPNDLLERSSPVQIHNALGWEI